MKKQSRLKIFTVTVNASHESFNGYDLNDGDTNYIVEALNMDSAGKKALKLANSQGGGYYHKVSGVKSGI